MSLTRKQIDELREYAKDRKGELAKMIKEAADTIESLSAKLSAANLERSSQYYHNGWIPCSERMPETDDEVLATYIVNDIVKKRYVETASWNDSEWVSVWDEYRVGGTRKTVIAWMPLPKPYTGGGKE